MNGNITAVGSTLNKLSSGMPSSRRVELLGPRPQALSVAKNSQQIKKPPVIIYLSPPKIIHARPQDFMSLVQRLTGNNNRSADSTETIGSERDLDRRREEGVVDSDPLLLTLGGQVPATGFFSCSPSTNACLQEFGFWF